MAKTSNPRVQALRIAAKAFLIIAAGGHLLPEEGKMFADLCCLSIPMKDRFTRKELDDISNSVKGCATRRTAPRRLRV